MLTLAWIMSKLRGRQLQIFVAFWENLNFTTSNLQNTPISKKQRTPLSLKKTFETWFFILWSPFTHCKYSACRWSFDIIGNRASGAEMSILSYVTRSVCQCVLCTYIFIEQGSSLHAIYAENIRLFMQSQNSEACEVTGFLNHWVVAISSLRGQCQMQKKPN